MPYTWPEMDEQERTHVTAIAADPLDPGPKARYADWLDARGEHDQARLVRVQTKIATTFPKEPEPALLAEEDRLLAVATGHVSELAVEARALIDFEMAHAQVAQENMARKAQVQAQALQTPNPAAPGEKPPTALAAPRSSGTVAVPSEYVLWTWITDETSNKPPGGSTPTSSHAKKVAVGRYAR